MTQADIAHSLEQIAVLLELHGENPFKVRAYANGARVVARLDSWPHWQGAKGIGAGLAAEISHLQETGSSPLLRDLLAKTPPGWLELLDIPQLGPKKVAALAKAFGDLDVERLESLCQAGEVAKLSGFGAKTEARLLEGIALWRYAKDRLLLPDADRVAEAKLAALRAQGAVWAAVAGEVRRRSETVGEVTVVEAPTQELLAFRLLYATGSDAHLRALEAQAARLGLQLSPEGLTRAGQPVPVMEEADIYRTLELPWTPPERRETGELDQRVSDLIDAGDLVGLFHCHTTWSDGQHSLEEMAEAARSLGYRYLGISDHSQTASYAGGLTPDRVKAQWQAIDELNLRWDDFQLLKGIESDILEDGALDYDDALLDGFDFVIVSVHSRFGLDRAKMTARIQRALEHPKTRFLGHMTGRLLLARAPYDLDKDAIYATAARHGVAIEINASPKRLDIDWRDIPQAARHGVRFAINPDAHHVDQLRYPAYGISMARKAGLSKDQVVNTRPWALIKN